MIAIVVLISVCVPVLEVMLFASMIDKAGIWTIVIPSAISASVGAIMLIRTFPKFMKDSVSNDKFQTFPTMQSYFDVTKMVSGFLLLVPGFISDIAGLVLLHPRLRGFTFIALTRLVASKTDDES